MSSCHLPWAVFFALTESAGADKGRDVRGVSSCLSLRLDSEECADCFTTALLYYPCIIVACGSTGHTEIQERRISTTHPPNTSDLYDVFFVPTAIRI
jgi:hypothetical protein